MPGPESLDEILTLQLLVAWAGEGATDPPRLGWWRTSMAEEFGGEDLFQRLLPHTYRWAVLEAVREVAKRVDARRREATADADQLVSLYRLGFALDEQLDDRLRALKRAGGEPVAVLPGLLAVTSGWDKGASRAFSRRWATAPTPAHPPAGSSRGRSPSRSPPRAPCAPRSRRCPTPILPRTFG